MGNSSVRETAQFLFTFQYFISNNYSSGTISKAKYILHCKCKTFKVFDISIIEYTKGENSVHTKF